MIIEELNFNGFRNLEGITLKPCSGVNMICGENAQGKTNIIEGIWLFSGLKSFRGAKDAELVGFNEEFARLQVDFFAGKRNNKAKIEIQEKKKASLNGVALGSCAGLIGKFPVVVFAPSFMAIVKNGPSERRKFIDSAVCQIKPSFAAVLSEYNKLLLQRNTVLKDIKFESSLFDILELIDVRLAQIGSVIREERKKYVELLSKYVGEIYNGVSDGREKTELSYIEKTEASEKSLYENIVANRKKDILNKTTGVGPHRDDMEILINGISARVYGSQGQQRSCAISVKLGEAAVMREITGEQPVALLDDVMSELDVSRQDYILNHIKDWQVFITCCEPTTTLRMCSGKIFSIKKGAVV